MTHCDMGVDCELHGTCYAAAMGSPERCGRPDVPRETEPEFEEGDWICLEGMDKWQFKAYEYGVASSVQFVNDVLDGTRLGGTMNEPGHSLRERLMELSPQRQWERFIALLNEKEPIKDGKHVAFLGGIEKYRQIFMEANERKRATDSPAD